MADNKLSWQESLNQARAGVPFNPFQHNHSGYAAGNGGKIPATPTSTQKSTFPQTPTPSYGHITQDGIGARAAAYSPSKIYIDSEPLYRSSAINSGMTADNYWEGSFANNSDYNYSGKTASGLRPLHSQWWLDTGAFSAWEDFGVVLAYPSWGVRIGFGLALGFVALLIALANSWPGPGTLFAMLAGGILGMAAPVPLGRVILVLRTIAGQGLAMLTWLVAIAAVGLVVILGVRVFTSKQAVAPPTVKYSTPAAAPPVYRHHGKSTHHTQEWNLNDSMKGWTPPSQKASR